MGSDRFDLLTRTLASTTTRRATFGLAAVLRLYPLRDVRARKRKNKKQKKRCKQPCPVCRGCKKGRCKAKQDGAACGDGTCAGGVCSCTPQGTPCTTGPECCSRTCDFLVGGGTCAPCRGRSCSVGMPCCGGQSCITGYCGGCRDRAVSCTSSSQCCFSDCVSGACLSAVGGRCVRDVDCRACYLGSNCTNTCVNGSCAV
jgi:hypothetical protein